MSGDVVEVDPDDDAAFDAWYDVYAAAERLGREDLAVPYSRLEFRVEQRHRSSARWTAAYTLAHDGRAVAVGRLELPLRDNLGLAQVAVHTHPDHRRRGHGSRLLAHLEEVAARRGRSLLMAEAAFAYDGPADGRGAAGVEFARAHGFELALGDVMRVLPVPVPDDLLARLAATAAPHHTAYTLRSFVGRVPDDLARGFVEAGSLVGTDAPTGELEIEEEVPSVEVLREGEEVLAAQHRTRYGTVALTAGGEVAAYTDVVVPEPDPATGMQWGTLVRREHRGHRLGVAVKVANQQALQAARSDVSRLVTWNAASNGFMVAINEQLGFRPAERLGEFQKRLRPAGG